MVKAGFYPKMVEGECLAMVILLLGAVSGWCGGKGELPGTGRWRRAFRRRDRKGVMPAGRTVAAQIVYIHGVGMVISEQTFLLCRSRGQRYGRIGALTFNNILLIGWHGNGHDDANQCHRNNQLNKAESMLFISDRH